MAFQVCRYLFFNGDLDPSLLVVTEGFKFRKFIYGGGFNDKMQLGHMQKEICSNLVSHQNMEIRDTRNGKWHWVNNAVTADPHLFPAEKVVYYAVCTFAGYSDIHPSFERIAERSNLSIRKCKTAIEKLTKIGYLKVEKGGGRGLANTYFLTKAAKGCIQCTVSKECTPEQERVQSTTENGALSAPHIDKGYIDKERDIKNGFDRFWEGYPQKKGRVEAEKIWRKLSPSSSLQATIFSAVSRAAQTDEWLKQDGQFIPNPAKYLRGRRWEDEITKSRSLIYE